MRKFRKYYNSEKYVIKTIYKCQVSNSVKRRHPLPNYTEKEFIKWIKSQPNFKKLYNNWVNSGYETNLKPSVDRLEDDKGYSFKNIRLTTWEENNKKQHKKSITNSCLLKPVSQIDQNGEIINTFFSISEASRITGIAFQNISSVTNGKRKTAGGYGWN